MTAPLPQQRRHLVVVGFDGSPGSTAALDVALAEARRRGATLRVVTAWKVPAAVTGFAFSAMTAAEIYDELHEAAAGEARRRLAAAVDRIGPCPGVAVETSAVAGVASVALVDASEDAELLVVGRRGHNRLTEILLGSTAHGCVSHANCPVLVVPNGVGEAPAAVERASSTGARA